MQIVIASDHAGYELKQVVAEFIRGQLGHSLRDLGTHDQQSCDFVDYAIAATNEVVAANADFAILLCGTGIGMCIAANKIPGARAALCSECFSARAAREHNDANVLCLGGRVIGPELAKQVVAAFLAGHRDDTGRHCGRRQKVAALDDARKGDAAC